MTKIQEKLLMIGSIIGAILTILNFFNVLVHVVDFFLIHWILSPLILFMLSFIIVYYYFQDIISKKVQQENKIIAKSNVRKKYRRYRNIIIIILAVISIFSILYSYYEIYWIPESELIIDIPI